MAAEINAIEQAVSRTLRDSLERIQRSSEELHQAINDLVSACASSRPANALPPMIRAHTAAASLSASLEVLSRFVTGAMQPAVRAPFEQEISRATSLIAAELAGAIVQPEAPPAHLMEQNHWTAPEPLEQKPGISDIREISYAVPVLEEPPVTEMPPAVEPEFLSEPVPAFVHHLAPESESAPGVEEQPGSEPSAAEHVFNLDSLSPEAQELHRRAFRVAKVSMQDIKMLRPEDVRLGRENKDLCFRLRDDIEKAHKEYDRRFQSLNSDPVDYFYDWMVEILAGGDPQVLGEYPYPSPVLHR
jgi:hypothetical protein